MASSHGNKPSDFAKDWEYLDEMSDCHLNVRTVLNGITKFITVAAATRPVLRVILI
jgi:hypothetical protein